MVDGLVSIIMPSWNTERFIAETIQSVIDQTYKNWELIIVDDCYFLGYLYQSLACAPLDLTHVANFGYDSSILTPSSGIGNSLIGILRANGIKSIET